MLSATAIARRLLEDDADVDFEAKDALLQATSPDLVLSRLGFKRNFAGWVKVYAAEGANNWGVGVVIPHPQPGSNSSLGVRVFRVARVAWIPHNLDADVEAEAEAKAKRHAIASREMTYSIPVSDSPVAVVQMIEYVDGVFAEVAPSIVDAQWTNWAVHQADAKLRSIHGAVVYP